jgi:RND family efflux transporter MFP subunit
VEVGAIEHGEIELHRTFSGTLEAPAEFVVAPKVGGRVVRIVVDFSDPVERDQVVAELDNDEYLQAVAQAEADLAVAKANLAEARSSLEIAARALERVTTLRERGIASESQLDTARAEHLAKEAAVEVDEAQVTRAEAALATARIRLGYTTVTAGWSGGDERRVVAERFVDEGGTVAANAPLLSIVELDPIHAVIFVTERDYARLSVDQTATLSTDAYPGETFSGRITRVAPVFRQASRQARVEVTVDNPDQRLKPGMFVRVEIVLDRARDATIVPIEALTTRDGRDVVFVVAPDGESVSMRAVEIGIRQGSRAQVFGEGLVGRVVTLGQQLVDDGSRITVPEVDSNPPGEDSAP